MNAYTGKILFVDLTQGSWFEQTIPGTIYEKYLAGVGLGVHVLYEHIPAGADALGAENVLGFVVGALTGTGAVFSGRWMAVGKSPLTGGWGDANCGGNFGAAIKQCGYDGIFFTGQASQPVYLCVDGNRIEILSASAIWGKDAVESEAYLVEKHGKRARAAVIGPAGEKLSLISGIVNDKGRLAARSGLGAVMGSKKLKAVVLAGTKPAPVADLAAVKKISKEIAGLIPGLNLKFPLWLLPLVARFLLMGKNVNRQDGLMSLGALRQWGTPCANQLAVVTGDAPIKNWRGTPRDFPHAAVNPQRVQRYKRKDYRCNACPLGCGALIEPPKGGFKESHRPEYETATSFGALLLNRDMDAVMLLNELTNRAGLDSISTGAVVAFALDCFEHGLLTEQDTGGLKLAWGDSKAIISLVEKIILREGIGDVLADGVRLAAARIGKGAEKYAMHAGGQELPMHDPRFDPGMGVFYISDPTPGRHTVSSDGSYDALGLYPHVTWAPEILPSYPRSEWYQASEKGGKRAAAGAMYKMLVDGAGLCTFGARIGLEYFPLFGYLNAACGWNKTPDEYMEIGRRIQSLRQAFNIKHGMEPASVTLPELAYGKEPVANGPNKGKAFDVYAMRSQYWKAMGWDAQTGHPPKEAI